MKAGWEMVRLRSSVTFVRGLVYSKKDEVEYSSTAVLRANNIDLESGSIILSDIRYITNVFRVPGDKKVKPNTVIICTASGSKSHLGKVAFVDKDYGMAFGGFMAMLIPNPNLDGKFLFYTLKTNSFKEQISSISDGTNINNLKFGDIADYEFPLPPLPEQQRIVRILDAAFAQLDRAKELTERNLSNAKALFESYLNEVFTKRGVGWEERRLGEVARFIDYRGKTPNKTKSGIRLITAKNVKMGFISLNPAEYISPDDYDTWMTRGFPQKGDVVFTTEAPLANIAQLDTDEKVVFAQRIIVLQARNNFVSNDFLKWLLMTKSVQSEIKENGTGSTVTGIKASLLKQIKLLIPISNRIQSEMAHQANETNQKVHDVLELMRARLNNLIELRQSLLHQAFNGEL